MPSDEITDLLRVPWTLYAGDANNIDITPGNDYVRTCPGNLRITALRASAQAATASTQFVVELLRGTTVLVTLTSATPYVVGVILEATGLDLRLSSGDLITVRVRGSDADTDDLFGLIVEATIAPLLPPQ